MLYYLKNFKTSINMRKILILFPLFVINSLVGQGFNLGPSTGSEIGGFAIADFDKDGYNDIFGLDYYFSGEVDIYYFANNKANPVNFVKKILFRDTDLKSSINAGDYDKDGDIDVLYSRGAGFELSVFVNDGLGGFTSKALNAAGTKELRFYDLDNDGDLDIVGIDIADKILTGYINNGSQVYTKKSFVTGIKTIKQFDVADINGDKYLDIVVGYDENSGEQVLLYKNNGSNTFVKSIIQSESFDRLTDVIMSDLNKDGKVDVVGLSSDALWVWTQKDATTYEKKVIVPFIENITRDMEIADFNGDGIPDIVVTTNSKGIFWLENTSKENLTYTQKEVGGVSPGFEAVSTDLDNDGDKDIVVTNGELWWYNNNITQLPSTAVDVGSLDFNVFPNPVTNQINVTGKNDNLYFVAIYNLIGQEVLKTYLIDGKVNIQSLRSGQYIMTMHDKEGKLLGSEKIIKQ